ncbi:HTTM domain-containing protein [Elongatibacter sediminis]|uniref:HTTM domain-containing protein n=1 Tax=Elongatibacter sediminis TaxID=3119006 RepID=A0AAW9RDC8_9GAMM
MPTKRRHPRLIDLKFSRDQFILAGFSLLLVLNAVRNTFLYDFYRLTDVTVFHFPLIAHPLLEMQATGYVVTALFWFSLPLVFTRFAAAAFFVHSAGNLFALTADLYAFHHDLALSTLIFTFVGIFQYSKSPKALDFIKITVVITYFLAGLNKLSMDYLEGAVVQYVLESTPKYTFLGDLLPFLGKSLSVPMAWYALIAELIILPIGLLVFRRTALKLVMLTALPFHLGILMTTVGTLYNSLYPFCFIAWAPKSMSISLSSIWGGSAIDKILLLAYTLICSVILLLILGLLAIRIWH